MSSDTTLLAILMIFLPVVIYLDLLKNVFFLLKGAHIKNVEAKLAFLE